MVEVAALYIYPVKSCAGIRCERAMLDARGLRYDRGWMIVDGHGAFVTQRAHPRLALIAPRLEADTLRLSTPEGQAVSLPIAGVVGPTRRVRVWHDWCEAVDQGDRAAQFLSDWLGEAVRLVRMANSFERRVDPRSAKAPAFTGFSDGYPLLLVSEASLDDLNARLDTPLPMNRFRPNLVVTGCDPYAEDGWRQVRINAVSFDVAKPCERCTVTTTDQATGERGVEPLRTLAAYRRVGAKVYFGQNLVHRTTGAIAVGEPVEIMPREQPPREQPPREQPRS